MGNQTCQKAKEERKTIIKNDNQVNENNIAKKHSIRKEEFLGKSCKKEKVKRKTTNTNSNKSICSSTTESSIVLRNINKGISLNKFFQIFFENKTKNLANKNINFDRSLHNDSSEIMQMNPTIFNESPNKKTCFLNKETFLNSYREEEKKIPRIECCSHNNKNNNLIKFNLENNNDENENANKSTFLTTKTTSKLTKSLIANSTISNSTINKFNYLFAFNSQGEVSDTFIHHTRLNYFTQLVLKNVLPTTQEDTVIKTNKIFIFDWDDTLFCTSHFFPNGVFKDHTKISERVNQNIKELEQLSLYILKFAISKGDTFIITNSANGWVERTSKKYYPDFSSIINQLTIISARSEFEAKYPGNMKEWKHQTFLKLTDGFNLNLVTNILCFGDSIYEIEACQVFAAKFEKVFIKSVKFRENPNTEELIKELKLVKKKIEEIYSLNKSLKINVEKK